VHVDACTDTRVNTYEFMCGCLCVFECVSESVYFNAHVYVIPDLHRFVVCGEHAAAIDSQKSDCD